MTYAQVLGISILPELFADASELPGDRLLEGLEELGQYDGWRLVDEQAGVLGH